MLPLLKGSRYIVSVVIVIIYLQIFYHYYLFRGCFTDRCFPVTNRGTLSPPVTDPLGMLILCRIPGKNYLNFKNIYWKYSFNNLFLKIVVVKFSNAVLNVTKVSTPHKIIPDILYNVWTFLSTVLSFTCLPTRSVTVS